jgi:uncharacterized protein (TIGR00296 family)
MLTKEEGKRLLNLARQSIESYFSKQDTDLSQFKDNPKFNKEQGVFVTLNKNDNLRGCIGFPYPTTKLYKAIFEAARSAAFEDPRFPNVEESELKDIKIDISVLTVPEEMTGQPEDYPKNINIGEDGLIIKTPMTSGLLLPQVFTEYKSTPEQALAMTCQKAGLPGDAWKEKETKVLKFQAQIFEEK